VVAHTLSHHYLFFDKSKSTGEANKREHADEIAYRQLGKERA
jgi:hypothetical protein